MRNTDRLMVMVMITFDHLKLPVPLRSPRCPTPLSQSHLLPQRLQRVLRLSPTGCKT